MRVVRELVLATGEPLVAVADTLEGHGRHLVEWRFPLPPGGRAEVTGRDVRFALGDAARWLLPVDGDQAVSWTLEPGWVSPSYGVRHETLVLTGRGELQLPHRMIYLFSTHHRTEAARAADAGAAGLHPVN